MTKTYSRVAVSLLALAMVLGAAGCASGGNASGSDQQKAMDKYVAAVQSAVPGILDATPGVYSSAEINAVGSNTLEFAYYYADQMDAEATASGLDGVVDSLQSVCDSSVFPEMIDQGIKVDPKVRYTYYNADGSKIWERTFSPS